MSECTARVFAVMAGLILCGWATAEKLFSRAEIESWYTNLVKSSGETLIFVKSKNRDEFMNYIVRVSTRLLFFLSSDNAVKCTNYFLFF